LLDSNFFEEITDEELNLLLDHCGSLAKYQADQVVLRQGERDDSNLFIILVGKVKVVMVVESAAPVVLAELEHGDMFGEFALFTREARSANVITEEYTEVLKIDMDLMDKMFEVHPQTAFNLVKYIACESAKKLYRRQRVTK
jgi:CRP-like cAMP-binding protein